jgi:serine/threonine protein kinase
MNLLSGREVAWSTVHLHNLSDYQSDALLREVKIQKKMKHKHLMPLLDRWIDQKRQIAVIITPLATPLREFTENWRDHIRIGPVRRWLTQLLDALSYLHTHEPRVIHRDLKLDNIMLSPEGQVWLGDYGLARYAKSSDNSNSREKNTQFTKMIGTPAFMAPELFEEENYSYKVDVYAFGMTMVELLSGRPPFRDCGHRLLTLVNKLQAGEIPDEIHMIRSVLARNMIKWCIHKDSKMRPDTQDLMLHPFLMPCMFDPVNSKLPLRLNQLEITHTKLRNELSALCEEVMKAAKNSKQRLEAKRVIQEARDSLFVTMERAVEAAQIAAKKDVMDQGFVKYVIVYRFLPTLHTPTQTLTH